MDQKYLESSEMWCWKWLEISLTDRVRDEEVLHTIMKGRNVVRIVNIGKANWIGYVLCRDCILEQIMEGKIKGRKK
jgi:hypothetical protein